MIIYQLKHIFQPKCCKESMSRYGILWNQVMEKKFARKKQKEKFKAQWEFLKMLKAKTVPLLTTLLSKEWYLISRECTIQHSFSWKYCNRVKILLLQMLHKDNMWLNVWGRYYVSWMAHFVFDDKIVLCIDTILGHIFTRTWHIRVILSVVNVQFNTVSPGNIVTVSKLYYLWASRNGWPVYLFSICPTPG